MACSRKTFWVIALSLKPTRSVIVAFRSISECLQCTHPKRSLRLFEDPKL